MTPESQNLEWKRSWRDEYLEWICGFANAQGGVLEIGKDDGGEVVGVTGVLSLVEEIPNKVRSLLGIVVEVNLKSDDAGLEYIEIVVEPHTNPITYRGRVHYRSGSTKQVLEGRGADPLPVRKTRSQLGRCGPSGRLARRSRWPHLRRIPAPGRQEPATASSGSERVR